MGHTRAKCTQVIIKVRPYRRKSIDLPEDEELLLRIVNAEAYLQPASLILLAYIFPISPIPIIPTDFPSAMLVRELGNPSSLVRQKERRCKSEGGCAEIPFSAWTRCHEQASPEKLGENAHRILTRQTQPAILINLISRITYKQTCHQRRRLSAVRKRIFSSVLRFARVSCIRMHSNFSSSANHFNR